MEHCKGSNVGETEDAGRRAVAWLTLVRTTGSAREHIRHCQETVRRILTQGMLRTALVIKSETCSHRADIDVPRLPQRALLVLWLTLVANFALADDHSETFYVIRIDCPVLCDAECRGYARCAIKCIFQGPPCDIGFRCAGGKRDFEQCVERTNSWNWWPIFPTQPVGQVGLCRRPVGFVLPPHWSPATRNIVLAFLPEHHDVRTKTSDSTVTKGFFAVSMEQALAGYLTYLRHLRNPYVGWVLGEERDSVVNDTSCSLEDVARVRFDQVHGRITDTIRSTRYHLANFNCQHWADSALSP